MDLPSGHILASNAPDSVVGDEDDGAGLQHVVHHTLHGGVPWTIRYRSIFVHPNHIGVSCSLILLDGGDGEVEPEPCLYFVLLIGIL